MTDPIDAVSAAPLRTAWNPYTPHPCPECGVAEGTLHAPACAQAICWRCGIQGTTCLWAPGTQTWAPYLAWPPRCWRCGKVYPLRFVVSKAVWRETLPVSHRKARLCETCFHFLRLLQGLPAVPVTVVL